MCGNDFAAAGGHHQAATLLMTRVLGGLPGAVDASILSFDRYGFDILAQTATGRKVILENLFNKCFRAILAAAAIHSYRNILLEPRAIAPACRPRSFAWIAPNEKGRPT